MVRRRTGNEYVYYIMVIDTRSNKDACSEKWDTFWEWHRLKRSKEDWRGVDDRTWQDYSSQPLLYTREKSEKYIQNWIWSVFFSDTDDARIICSLLFIWNVYIRLYNK